MNTCQHCGSKNTTKTYTDTFPKSGNDCDVFTELVSIELFDCLECGELAQDKI